MNLRSFHLLIFLIVSMTTPLFSQKIWSLEDCINHAINNNLQILQAQSNLDLYDQNIIQSRGSALPTINANGNHNYNFGRNIDPFTNQFTTSKVQSNNFSLSGSLILYNGFQIRNTIQQNRYEYLSQSFQIETLKNNIALNIAAGYLDILFYKELIITNQNQLNQTSEQITYNESLVKSGVVAPTILIQLRAQLSSEQAQFVKSQNALAASYFNLKQLLDLNATDSLEIVKPELQNVESSLLPDYATIVQEAIANQPQVKSSAYRKLSTMEALQAAKGRLSPRLSLNASLSSLYSSSAKNLIGQEYTGTRLIGYTENTLENVYAPTYQNVFEDKPFNNQLRDNYNRFIGFSLSIPVLNGLSTRTAINRAKINLKNAELDFKINQRTIEQNVFKAHLDLLNSKNEYLALQKVAESRNENFSNAEKQFRAGLINTFEYNQTKNQLAMAQSDLIRAKYDFLFKLKILDFYKGSPLK